MAAAFRYSHRKRSLLHGFALRIAANKKLKSTLHVAPSKLSLDARARRRAEGGKFAQG